MTPIFSVMSWMMLIGTIVLVYITAQENIHSAPIWDKRRIQSRKVPRVHENTYVDSACR